MDNGAAFRSNALKYACARLGVALLHSRPYIPQGRGKIERFFRSVRMQFIPLLPAELTLEILNERLARWIDDDYHARKHSSTGQTPLERYLAQVHLLRAAPGDLRDYFRIPARRKVDKDRTVTLEGHVYEAPLGLMGQTISLLYHQDDLSRVEVVRDDQSLGFLTPLDQAVNSRIKRDSTLKTTIVETPPTPAATSGSPPRFLPLGFALLRKLLMIALTTAYGLSREPFAQDIPIKDLYPLPGLESFLERFDYAIAQRLVTVITGEVGAGKSTSLRAAVSRLHPSQYCVIPLVATSGSLMELLRQVCINSGDAPASSSIASTLSIVKAVFSDLAAKKQVPVLTIDEAHLLRLDVFAQLHTLVQVDFDSRTLLPIVLFGQTALIDKLLFHTSRPFASRVVGRSHLESLQRDHMAAYVAHRHRRREGRALRRRRHHRAPPELGRDPPESRHPRPRRNAGRLQREVPRRHRGACTRRHHRDPMKKPKPGFGPGFVLFH